MKRNEGYSEDQRLVLFDNVKNAIIGSSTSTIVKDKGPKEDEDQRLLRQILPSAPLSSSKPWWRKLAEESRGWEILNPFFDTLDWNVKVNQSYPIGSASFIVEEISCQDFGISDIETSAKSGTNLKQDISIQLKGVTATCELTYSYSNAGWLGSGSGKFKIDTKPESSTIDTVLSFFSDDFRTEPPTSSVLTCSSGVQVNVDLGSFLLNFFFKESLTDYLSGPGSESFFCDPITALESILSDVVLEVYELIDSLSDPIPPHLTNKLAPEMKLFRNYSQPIYVDFIPMQLVADFLDEPIESVVNMISSLITPVNGDPIRLPVNITLEDEDLLGRDLSLDLKEIRISGLDNFTFDPLSHVGNYTLSTTYEIDNIGFEVDFGLRNNVDGSIQDNLMLKVGLHDVVFDFALLLLVEESILEALEVFTPIINAAMTLINTANTIIDFIREIIARISIVDITQIRSISDIVELISSFNFNEIIGMIDFSVFAQLVKALQELIDGIQSIDIINIINHVANTIYALEITSFSLTFSDIDAPEVSGLTQFTGPQEMFNQASDAVIYMLQGSLINTVDYFLQVTTRGYINSLIQFYSIIYESCLDELNSSTLYVPSDDLGGCVKVELFQGGELSVDYSDPTCSNISNHTGENISYYDFSGKDVAYFSGGNYPRSQLYFVEDFFVPELQVYTNIVNIGNTTSNFFMSLTYPSCTQSLIDGKLKIEKKANSIPTMMINGDDGSISSNSSTTPP